MNRITRTLVIFLMGLIVAMAAWAQQAPGDSEPLSREETVVVEVVATISDIDYETRRIDIEDSQGNVRSLTADERVKRFNELKVGDEVTVDIVVSALAEVRAPTADEVANPGVVKRGVVRSPGDGAMAGSMTESVTSYVTIVALNLLNETITVLTAEGELADVRAQSVDNLKKLRLGETIVITYSESVAISVEPTGAASAE